MFPRRPALVLSSPKPFSGLVGCVVSGPIKAMWGELLEPGSPRIARPGACAWRLFCVSILGVGWVWWGSFWSLGRRASQDREPALGNCPPSPKPARLQSAGQALDRRAHLRLVYEA